MKNTVPPTPLRCRRGCGRRRHFWRGPCPCEVWDRTQRSVVARPAERESRVGKEPVPVFATVPWPTDRPARAVPMLRSLAQSGTIVASQLAQAPQIRVGAAGGYSGSPNDERWLMQQTMKGRPGEMINVPPGWFAGRYL